MLGMLFHVVQESVVHCTSSLLQLSVEQCTSEVLELCYCYFCVIVNSSLIFNTKYILKDNTKPFGYNLELKSSLLTMSLKTAKTLTRFSRGKTRKFGLSTELIM